MSLSIKPLQTIIHQLEQDIYPSTLRLLNINMHPDSNAAFYTDDALLTIQSTTLSQLKNELESLALYEKRLVFPAIQTYINQENKSFIPDITTIKKLIANKDEKIHHYINNFNIAVHEADSSIKTTWKNNGIGEWLAQLCSHFKNKFLPVRVTWMHLLDDLEQESISTSHSGTKLSPCKNRENGTCCCKKNEEKQEDKYLDNTDEMNTLSNQPNI